MSKSISHVPDHGEASAENSYDPNSVTVAAFAPSTTSGYSASAKQRSTVIVHKKSPLLVATPPQITRALAHSHPFILPLNRLFGLLSWTTDDPWESFLLVCAFWGVTLYGDVILRYGGPIILVTFIILGMYSRRYSPLSSTTRTGEKLGHKRQTSDTSPQHKSLDEIVETLQELTGRCNILLEPFFNMTDFLSTQRTATTATTRPALTTLFIRIVLITPGWVLLTLPPLHILTAQRVILAIGTIVLSWHSRPAKITRVILWRSVFLRRSAAFVTGLDFPLSGNNPPLPPRRKSQANIASEVATKNRSPGVRFTFILYENQRRWIGLGWTTSLFSGERGPWTDEHLNSAPAKDEFELPDVQGGIAKWRWVDASEWQIENGDAKQHKRSGSKTGPAGTVSPSSKPNEEIDGGGWIYYDNKWNDGRREDGWGRYTRRRKWYRDAELVEITPSTEQSPAPTTVNSDDEAEKIRRAKAFASSLQTDKTDLADSVATIKAPQTPIRPSHSRSTSNNIIPAVTSDDNSSIKEKKKKGWFGRNRDRSDSKSSSSKNTANTAVSEKSNASRDGPHDDVYDRWRDTGHGSQARMSINEDVALGLG
ncbi:hypothetical protein LTS08_007957 [Lithohypha guttulata]|nr:hypothetical protein LTS08_007957 [Lithohypha guttulata]